mgnify:CR=1 FL=1
MDDESCKSSILTPRQPLADIDLAQIQKSLQRNCPFEFSEAIQKDSSAAKEKLGEQLKLQPFSSIKASDITLNFTKSNIEPTRLTTDQDKFFNEIQELQQQVQMQDGLINKLQSKVLE